MNNLSISIDGGASSFVPGQSITGTISWQYTNPLTSLELRLFWYTQGRGTQDVEVIDVLAVENPLMSGNQTFSFMLPESPFSFSGKLISLLWALELVAKPGNDVSRTEITLSPTGREVVLDSVELPAQ